MSRKLGATVVRAAWAAIALLAVLDLALRLLLPRWDLEVLIVTGGSMAPALQAGDAVIVDTRPAHITAGDLVVVPGRGTTGAVAHRVVSIHQVDGRRWLRTQGDHNTAPDPNLTPVTAVQGAAVWRLPLFGRLLLLYDDGWGRALVVLLLIAPVLAGEGRTLASPLRARVRRLKAA